MNLAEISPPKSGARYQIPGQVDHSSSFAKTGERGAFWLPGLVLLSTLCVSFLAWINLSVMVRHYIHQQIELNRCVARTAREFQQDFNKLEALNKILEITRLEVRAAPPLAKPPLITQTYALAASQEALLLKWKWLSLAPCQSFSGKEPSSGVQTVILKHSGIHYSRLPPMDSHGARPLEWKPGAISAGSAIPEFQLKPGFSRQNPEIRFQAQKIKPIRWAFTKAHQIRSGFKAWLPPLSTQSAWGGSREWRIKWYLSPEIRSPTSVLLDQKFTTKILPNSANAKFAAKETTVARP